MKLSFAFDFSHASAHDYANDKKAKTDGPNIPNVMSIVSPLLNFDPHFKMSGLVQNYKEVFANEKRKESFLIAKNVLALLEGDHPI